MLSQEIICQVSRHLPALVRLATWSRVYSLSSDGTNYRVLLTATMSRGPCLLLVRTLQQQVIGAYLNQSLEISPAF